VAIVTEAAGKTIMCQTCKTGFIIPKSETAVCCPICRMNRIKQVE